jgi:hypothetical protein
MTTDTTPIPHGRYAAPDPAPNRPTECPRCGAPAISRHGVALHDLDHRRRDALERRQERVLEALEGMLAAFDGDPSDDPQVEGEPKTFRAWVAETDHILDTLAGKVEELAGKVEELAGKVEELARVEHPVATLEAPEIEPLPWPGDAAPEDAGEVPNPAEPVLAAAPAPAPEPEDDDDLDDLDAVPHPASRF